MEIEPRGNKSADYDATEEEYRSADEHEEIIVGTDPLYVSLVDETIVRSFPTRDWEYTFGDGIYYGLRENERRELKENFSNPSVREKYSAFELPGDAKFFEDLSVGGGKWLDKRVTSPQFVYTDIMNPTKRRNVGGVNRYETYPSANGEFGKKHVTSYGFTSGERNDYGRYVSEYVDAGDTSYEYDEVFKRSASGTIAVKGQTAKDCERTGNCLGNTSLGNTVGHLFMGPGVYTISFKQKPNSPIQYYGELLEPNNFLRSGVEYVTRTVVVEPVCPCITIGLYSEYEDPPNNTRYKLINGKLPHAALSSEEYTADDPENYGVNQSYIDFNPKKFQLTSSGGSVIFEGISGFAPYVMATCEANVKSNSFPVSGVDFFYDDWYTDMSDQETDLSVTAYEVGWPLWKPKVAPGQQSSIFWDEEKKATRFFNTHTFIMPGLYSVRAEGHFEYERIPDYWHDWAKEHCEPLDTGKAFYVLVRELMPREPRITLKKKESKNNGTTVLTMKFDVTPGSFPICNVVWDFDDGSEKLRLTRNTDGGYPQREIVIDGTTATYVGNARYDRYDKSGINYGALDASAGSAAPGGSFKNGVYPEFDPRDWEVTHEFKRTSVEDKPQFMVSAMGYVCNTETLTYATYLTGPGEIEMPDFKETEGDVRLIDVRLKDSDDKVVMTLEGDKEGKTNLYNFEWEVK